MCAVLELERVWLRLERAAALVRVRLLHEHDRLVAGEGRANLAEAVLGEGRGK